MGADILLKKAQSNRNGLIQTVSLDVTSQKSVDSAFKIVESKLAGNGLWALVNNAGLIGVNGPDDWLSVREYQGALDVNTLGVIRITQRFKSLVKRTSGRIVTVASVAGRVPFRNNGPYVVSKYAVEGYMDVLRQEMRDFGVTVHLLEPGFFRNTGLFDGDHMQKMQQSLWDRTSDEIQQEYGPDYLAALQAKQARLIRDIGNPNPQIVADTYFHAITARFPKSRYPVGLDARMFFIPVSILPTFLQDGIFIVVDKFCGGPIPAAVQ